MLLSSSPVQPSYPLVSIYHIGILLSLRLSGAVYYAELFDQSVALALIAKTESVDREL